MIDLLSVIHEIIVNAPRVSHPDFHGGSWEPGKRECKIRISLP